MSGHFCIEILIPDKIMFLETLSSLSLHLVTPGHKEAHQLAGIQRSLIRVIRVSKSWRHGSASPGQHNGNSLHKENGGHPLPIPM